MPVPSAMRSSSACLALLFVLLGVLAGRSSSLVSAQGPPAATVTWVSGCAVVSGNGTAGCIAGDVILATGTDFTAQPSIVVVGGRNCTNVTVVSSTLLTATLPAMNGADGLYAVQVYNGQWSLPYSLVTYGALPPLSSTITAVRGCAVSADSGSVGCSYNDTLWVYGSNLPTGSSVSVLVGGVNATRVVSWNSSVVSARLPYIATRRSVNYTVQVVNSTMSANNVKYVEYVDQTPGVWRITGCRSDNNATNATSNCYLGDTVTIDGHHFVPSPDYPLYLNISGPYSFPCLYFSTARIQCQLPLANLVPQGQYLPVTVTAGALTSDPRPLIMYGATSSSSSSSSTGGGRFITSSSSSRTNTSAIFQIWGCPAVGCSYGDRITIVGIGFDESTTATVGWQDCTSPLNYNSTQLSCILPPLTTLGGAYPCSVVVANVASNVVWVNYTSQRPVVWSVSGCSSYSGNSNATVDCGPNQQVVIAGSQFLSYVSASIGHNPCAISVHNRTHIWCTLTNSSSLQYGYWQPVVVTSSSITSNVQPSLVMFGMPGSASSSSSTAGRLVTSSSSSRTNSSTGGGGFLSSSSSSSGDNSTSFYITSITGCPADGCSYADTITLKGGGFTWRSAVSIAARFGWYTLILNSTTMTCMLPAVATLGGPLPVYVIDGGLTTNTLLLNFRSQQPTVTAVSGCSSDSTNGNATVNCRPNMKLVINGTQFLYQVKVWVDEYSCAITAITSTGLTCTLPATSSSPYYSWLPVIVTSSFLNSSAANLVMYGNATSSASSSTAAIRPVSSSSAGTGLAPPYINSTTGCPDRDVYSCSWNQTLTIHGSFVVLSGLGDPYSVVLQDNASYRRYLCNNVTVLNSALITCQLPLIGTRGGSFSVTVTRYADSKQSNSVDIWFASQQPTVSRVTGCNRLMSTGTYNCSQYQNVTIYGSQFFSVNFVTVDGRPVRFLCLNSSTLTAVLPRVGTAVGNWMPIVVTSIGLPSDAAYLVMFGLPAQWSWSSSSTGSNALQPSITQILGCPINDPSGSAGGCSGSTVVTILGSNFASSAVAYFESPLQARLQSCSVDSQGKLMSCTLPNIGTTGNAFSLYVLSAGAYSNRLTVWYSDQTPLVYSVSGCAGGAYNNATRGCTSGTVVTIFGDKFYSPVSISIGNRGGACTNVEVVTLGRLHCSLPAYDSGTYTVTVRAQAGANSIVSRAVSLVTYDSNGGGGSTGTSKSGLTLDELVIVVLVVVVVVGLLLVCQVLYCLHHFAGVSFPRLARLSGGRLFSNPSVSSPAAHEINLGLLALDHQQHHPSVLMPAEQVQPPQPVSAPYQPAFLQQYSPVQPAPHPAPPAAPSAFPILYPRSFVPSPQYYQSVS